MFDPGSSWDRQYKRRELPLVLWSSVTQAALQKKQTAAPPGGRNIAIRRAVQRGPLLLAEGYAAERYNARRA